MALTLTTLEQEVIVRIDKPIHSAQRTRIKLDIPSDGGKSMHYDIGLTESEIDSLIFMLRGY